MSNFFAILEASAEMGVAQPVLLSLHKDSPHACRVSDEIGRGGVRAKLWLDQANTSIYLVDQQDASALLRAHCGTGGAIIAKKLDEDVGAPDYRMIGVLPSRIEVFSYVNGEETFFATAAYDQPDQDDELATGARYLKRVEHGGEVFFVWGGTNLKAELAGKLACIVFDGKLNDDQLESCLYAMFIDKPDAIAAAIIALRQTKGRQDRHIMRVLAERPVLAFMRKEVEKALANA